MVQGTGDEWLTDPESSGKSGGDDILVDPDQLGTFAKRIQSLSMDQFQASMNAGITPMVQATAQSRFSRIPESQMFWAASQRNLKAVMQFLGDVQRGLTVLSVAAQVIGVQYRNADATVAASLDSVVDAFTPVPTAGGDDKAGDGESTTAGDPTTTTFEYSVPDSSDTFLDFPPTYDKYGSATPFLMEEYEEYAPYDEVIAKGTSGEYGIPQDNDFQDKPDIGPHVRGLGTIGFGPADLTGTEPPSE
ncbi:MAG: hypothetical protein HKP61_01195 [Dactylosporangium sp.]|nr:hypothetical protein [Dactylosporangium sp.]NNJ59585.1 hypothetical protein [Dactylosporangium sp.]